MLNRSPQHSVKHESRGEGCGSEALLISGVAQAEDYLHNRKYLDHFRALEEQARKERVGHWLGYYENHSCSYISTLLLTIKAFDIVKR